MTPKNKYFKVTAKCGHVGKGNYVPVAFAVKAESRSAASQKVMTYHRVKKQLSDAIISCEEIDRDSYKELMQANKEFKYLQCNLRKIKTDGPQNQLPPSGGNSINHQLLKLQKVMKAFWAQKAN